MTKNANSETSQDILGLARLKGNLTFVSEAVSSLTQGSLLRVNLIKAGHQGDGLASEAVDR